MANNCEHFLIVLLLASTKANGILFPKDLEELCPYTNYCNATKAISNISKSIIPCCRPCSCDEDCGRTRNCCTYEMDTYNRDTNNVSCVKATVHQISYDPPGTAWYYMVDNCPDGRSCYDFGNNITMGIYPHSSSAKGLIYLNKECGHCNNDFALIAWNAAFVCKQDVSDVHLVALSSRVEHLINGQMADRNCFYRFLPAKNIDTSSEERIPESNIIRTCKPIEGVDVSEDYRKKCEMFNATYLVPQRKGINLVYGNVYCALCSGREREDICGDESAPLKAPTGLLMLLLEYSVDTGVTFGFKKREYCAKVRQKIYKQ